MSQAPPPEGAGAPLPREGRSWPELARAASEARAVTNPSPTRAVY